MPPAKRPARNTGPWSSSRILTSSSPIATGSPDIHAFLVTAISGWNADPAIYTEAEKKELIDCLPTAYRNYETDTEGRLKCPLTTDFVLDDSHIKSAVLRFKNDIIDGYYEKPWQNQARKAMEERRDGKFDAYLHEVTEENFGEIVVGGDAAESLFDPDMSSSDGEWSGKKTAKANGPSQAKEAVQNKTFQLKR